jgi:uncharacterized membrane protein YgdD (TMEM256/DUF423 family)
MWWRIAGVVGALGVLLGAFGAHGLQARVSDPHLLDIWDTGARYHLVHALALCAVAAHPRPPRYAGAAFLVGILVFSGSLYLIPLTGATWLGAVTPIGGLSLISGWLLLAWAPRSA